MIHCSHKQSAAAAAAAKSLQSCPTLCDPIDGSPPGSPIPGILEWVAISFFNAWRWKVKVKLLSPVRLWVTPWTAAYRAPPSMGFSRQEYRSGVPSPSLDFGYSDDFFETMSKIRFMTEIVDNLHFIKVKNLCSVKVTVKRMGRQATSQKNIFANDTSDKGPLSKIYKEGLKLNNEKTNNRFKNGPKTWTNTSLQKIYRWQVSMWKYSTS